MGTRSHRPAVVPFEDEQRQIQQICDALATDAGARALVVVNGDGQPIARVGEALDLHRLLQAGSATGAAIALLADKEFNGSLSPDDDRPLRFSRVAERTVLVLAWDRPPPGPVDRVLDRARTGLRKVLRALEQKMRNAR